MQKQILDIPSIKEVNKDKFEALGKMPKYKRKQPDGGGGCFIVVLIVAFIALIVSFFI